MYTIVTPVVRYRETLGRLFPGPRWSGARFLAGGGLPVSQQPGCSAPVCAMADKKGDAVVELAVTPKKEARASAVALSGGSTVLHLYALVAHPCCLLPTVGHRRRVREGGPQCRTLRAQQGPHVRRRGPGAGGRTLGGSSDGRWQSHAPGFLPPRSLRGWWWSATCTACQSPPRVAQLC